MKKRSIRPYDLEKTQNNIPGTGNPNNNDSIKRDACPSLQTKPR
jgi:hypothetical protein